MAIDEVIVTRQRRCEEAHTLYLARLNELADSSIDSLFESLRNQRTAYWSIEALGARLRSNQDTEIIVQTLVDFSGSHRWSGAVNEVLVRAGVTILPNLLTMLERSQKANDDMGVKGVLEAVVRFPDIIEPQIVQAVLPLFEHSNPEIRIHAAAAIWTIALPHGRPAIEPLTKLYHNDPNEGVRQDARDALIRLGKLE